MSDKTEIHKQLINARLLKNNGGWMYCSKCNNTIRYLCYSTYEHFLFSFTCKCGEQGSIEIGIKEAMSRDTGNSMLLLTKGRLCCPFD